MEFNLDKLKTQLTAKDSEEMQILFDHVANGGSATQWCTARGLRFSDLMRFIRANPGYKEAYDQAMLDRKEWAKERLLTEVLDLGTYTLADIFNADGSRKSVHEMPTGLISSIKELTADGDIKFQDKLKAISMYASELGLFTEKREIKTSMTLEQLIMEAEKK